jgi:hypothetical protein
MMDDERVVFEFPPETVALIDRLAKYLNVERGEVISKSLGLLQVWMNARKENRILVEKPESGLGKELLINIEPRSISSMRA